MCSRLVDMHLMLAYVDTYKQPKILSLDEFLGTKLLSQTTIFISSFEERSIGYNYWGGEAAYECLYKKIHPKLYTFNFKVDDLIQGFVKLNNTFGYFIHKLLNKQKKIIDVPFWKSELVSA